jgi:hypothetical protein
MAPMLRTSNCECHVDASFGLLRDLVRCFAANNAGSMPAISPAPYKESVVLLKYLAAKRRRPQAFRFVQLGEMYGKLR